MSCAGRPICPGCSSPATRSTSSRNSPLSLSRLFHTRQARSGVPRRVRLNRRLAPDVYLGVLPLVERAGKLSIGGEGAPVDWLVKMKRLDERFMLDGILANGTLTIGQLDRLIEALALFYRSATPVNLPPAIHLADWTRSLDYNKRVLLEPQFRIPERPRAPDRHSSASFFEARVANKLSRDCAIAGSWTVTAISRPEHIWLDDKVRII